jgi:hypothetical protein
MKLLLLALFLSTGFSVTAQEGRVTTVPAEIRGDWTVTKNLSERSLGCFDPADTKTLIGLKVSIGARQLLWSRIASTALNPEVSVISSYTFLFRYGKLPEELGLSPSPVTIVDVHPSEGIPVNALIRIDRSTILINACNIWLQASRDAPPGALPAVP